MENTAIQKIPIAEQLNACKYDPNRQPERQQILIKIENQNVASVQNFITITGMMKSGKSKYIAAMIAAGLSGHEVFGIDVRLPYGKNRIALFDTEQSDYDFYQGMNQIKKFIGIDVMPGNFDPYNMREHEPTDIIRMIENYLDRTPECGILVIDGVLDCLNSYNDEIECKRLVNLFKKWTKQKNVLIVAVLHRSKNSGTTLGHFGSMADRAAQSILTVEKDKERNCLIMRPDLMRSADDFTPIAITYDNQNHTWVPVFYVPEEENNGRQTKARPADLDISTHRINIGKIFNSQEVQDYSELLKGIAEIYAAGRNWAKEAIPFLLNEGILYRDQHGKYTNRQQARLTIVH